MVESKSSGKTPPIFIPYGEVPQYMHCAECIGCKRYDSCSTRTNFICAYNGYMFDDKHSAKRIHIIQYTAAGGLTLVVWGDNTLSNRASAAVLVSMVRLYISDQTCDENFALYDEWLDFLKSTVMWETAIKLNYYFHFFVNVLDPEVKGRRMLGTIMKTRDFLPPYKSFDEMVDFVGSDDRFESIRGNMVDTRKFYEMVAFKLFM